MPRVVFVVWLALAVFPGILPAAVLNYTGMGGDLTVATFDNMGNVIVGVTTLTIPVTDQFIIDPGDSVTVTLTGLQYPFAGDLQVSLALADSMNNVLVSGDLFNQIGLTNPPDPANPGGYGTQFGNSTSIDSGNYVFNSSFTAPSNDLWATAAPLGALDSIPSGNYWTSSAFFPTNDNLSAMFAGRSIQGNWILTITDNFPPNGSFTPGITSWGLSIDASPIPEPSTAPLMAASLLLIGALLYRRPLTFGPRTNTSKQA